jgi:hypothetical protein
MRCASFRGFLYLTALTFGLTAPLSGKAEPIGTSCADCPSYSGAFSINNQTGQTIKYQVRWGQKNNWKNIVLENGRIETHSYPLGDNPNGRAPAPHVRFDNIVNDGRNTMQDYHMQFRTVGYAGFGPKVNRSEPKRYFFRYAGNRLDLFAE